MSTQPIIMDGKTVSQQILEQCAVRVRAIVERTGVTPCLTTVLVGSDPASATYVKMKCKRCEAVGMKSLRVDMPETTTTAELVARIAELSADPAIHGILLQHPVPKQIDERAAFEAIVPSKDVDGVTIHSFGTTSFDLPGFGSCTPAGMMRLLDHYKVEIKGKHAVVIGRSPILGKPMAMMLLARHATVTICHSRTKDLPEIARQGDILVAAVGKANFVKGDWVKEGAVVLDAGYNEGNVGDVDYAPAAARASMITPVPGGVGPMTIATLIDQTATAAERLLGIHA
ncbi:MAG: bifunctional 5,10-methylene-tetrahydrofolate dehydrogenase/5,10-methylene-tetrahydrofolate cyclohydrolase [Candidatus Hydrogenedentes bacterium]|nr:bifunctional 5,10-methylene-tetrahydrofolate dehydrogenase/5,10-methylene-tetrahydrofolate cyclohydrolase [Candidatus Hydrogenedentota bacterium]